MNIKASTYIAGYENEQKIRYMRYNLAREKERKMSARFFQECQMSAATFVSASESAAHISKKDTSAAHIFVKERHAQWTHRRT